MKTKKRRKPKPHRKTAKVIGQPDPTTRKQVKRVLEYDRLIAVAWASDLGLNPDTYELRFDPTDWSQVWLMPCDKSRSSSSVAHMTLEEAIALAGRTLPVFMTLKAITGTPIVKHELGYLAAWK